MTNHTQIDWTKAPADATHCISLEHGTRLWYKIKENQPIYYYDTRNDKWLISSSTRQEIFGQYLYARPQEPLCKSSSKVNSPTPRKQHMTTAIQIDWTKAPADATHYWDDFTHTIWYKIEENQPIYCYDTRNDKWLQSFFTKQELTKEHLYTRPTAPLFKVGDRVYWPTRGVKVYTLTENLKNTGFPLRIQFSENKGHFTSFSTKGMFLTTDTCPSIFHATSEKQQALEQLYGVKFEDPNIPTGSDLARLKLEESNTPVLCYVSNESESDTRCVTLIVKVNEKGQFISHNQSTWLYAVLYDKPIQTGLM